jgi:hypothetical protein
MEQIAYWEANRFLASQEISRILWKHKVITTFTRARHQPLPRATSIQSLYTSHFPIQLYLVKTACFFLLNYMCQNHTCLYRTYRDPNYLTKSHYEFLYNLGPVYTRPVDRQSKWSIKLIAPCGRLLSGISMQGKLLDKLPGKARE